MSSQPLSTLKKPTPIQRLEEIFKVDFVQIHNRKHGSEHIDDHAYSLDENGILNYISLSNNNNLTDITPFLGLNLKELGFSKSAIENLSGIENEKNLEYLFLGGNNIRDISALRNLSTLKELAIWGNPVKNIEVLAGCKNLEELYIQNTACHDISFVKHLIMLKKLYGSGNKISDISALSELKNLEDIHFANNLIKNIDVLENIDSCKSINLNNNFINHIPFNFAKKNSWLLNSLSEYRPSKQKGVTISGNPLYYPPISVVSLGPETTQNYYEMAEKFGHEQLLEGRIIFIGDGSAGKSSLIERILYNTFELGKTQTNGVKIENYSIIHNNGKEILFHLWDFGGQEIQHAVHKFFFTEGCLYVLVLDNRKEEEPEYWLQQIESLGGGAPVLVVFNKHDDNVSEIADRKFLKEKYPNIMGFYNTSCKNGFGINDFKRDFEKNAELLKTVEEQFPNNWFQIKQEIEKCTSGSEHYLNYNRYAEICTSNNVIIENTQKLLLKYFTTIGAVTWFGDTFLNFLHVLSPTWITQGVYKIITSQKTDKLQGKINIKDFRELLRPLNNLDFIYDEAHYGYILSMMKKFDLCYSPDDKIILIPSAFGKMPKVEYSEYRGEDIRTYILQFKDYMPIALIHRFIAKNLLNAYDHNYWYTGIVILDPVTHELAMIHSDREAKRIYIRIKGEAPLGIWEHTRREFSNIASSYAKINYEEFVALDEKAENVVMYDDLISHVQAEKQLYFHPKLKRDFNVGYLLGFFQTQSQTFEKIEKGEIFLLQEFIETPKTIPPTILQIVNNISPNINNQINIDINVKFINELSSNLKGDTNYLIDELADSNRDLKVTLQKLIQFSEDSQSAKNIAEIKEKGWGRKLKPVIELLSKSGEQLKHISEGGEVLKNILHKIEALSSQFNLNDITELMSSIWHKH